jgi:GDPmannose 4,6-dehydratase
MLRDTKPDEIYNLGAQSDVGISFDIPVSTGDINALGTMRIIDSVRTLDLDTKIYQASTSELFGKVQETPQTETTPFYPRSPYGVSKLYAYWAIKNYRESYGMFGCNGILFNHESPLRGENFVTRKITKAVAEMYARDRKDPIELGNMDSKRDWGHAKDYVKGMWQMMQEQESDDYVLATGEIHSIRELVETAFKYIGETVLWGGTEKNEEGYNSRGDLIVKVNPDFYRPAEVDVLCGDPRKAEKKFGWERLYTFENLISEMVEADIEAIYKNKVV